MTESVRTSIGRSLAPLALMALIFALSSLADSGAERETWEIVARKVAHFSEYLLLTLLWAWALRPVSAQAIPLAAAITLLYAASDEFHQTFVEGRTGTPRDVVIDALGVAVAVAFLVYHRRVRADAVGKALGE